LYKFGLKTRNDVPESIITVSLACDVKSNPLAEHPITYASQ